MTATMVSRLVDAAEKLLEEGSLSSAFKRRAVSTAADYLPPVSNVFSIDQVREHIDQARSVIGRIENLPESDRVTLAAWLLFKKSRSQ